MKKYFIIFLGLLLTTATYAQNNQDMNWKNIFQHVTGSRTYKVEINRITPRIEPSSIPTSPYYIEVNKDKLVSYLPYIGRATNIAYGGGDGLNFTSEIRHYETVVQNDKKLVVRFRAKSSDDSYTYTLTFFENGTSSIIVQGVNRESISFGGDLIFVDKE